MHNFEAITNLAKAVLTVALPTGAMDTSLYDRAERLLRNVVTISKLDEVAAEKSGVNMFCLKVAALFSDAGLTKSLTAQWPYKVEPGKLPDVEKLLDLCEQVLQESLGTVLDPARMQKIIRIVRESAAGRPIMKDAMILSDARNLDDMGVTGIFNEFRRHVMGGKGVAEALELWRMKMDYRYWEARLKDGFHFESVRALARQRLTAAEQFMNQLEGEHTGRDISSIIGGQPT